MKQHVKEYFEKAAAKRRDHEKKKAEQKAKDVDLPRPSHEGEDLDSKKEKEEESDEDIGMDLTDDEVEKDRQDSGTPMTPKNHQFTNGDFLKRKRGDGGYSNGVKGADADATPSKRFKSESPPPPPPPPPRPTDGGDLESSTLSEMLMEEMGKVNGYADSQEAGYDVPPTHFLMDEPKSQGESPSVEIDPAPPPAVYARIRPSFSNRMEKADNIQSSLVFGEPLEPEAGRVDQERPYGVGMDFERMQRLQVHNGV